MLEIPATQAALVQLARGSASRSEFAMQLGINKSTLSRYETERLGIPTAVLNRCLAALRDASGSTPSGSTSVERALSHARQAVTELENVQDGEPRKRSVADRPRA